MNVINITRTALSTLLLVLTTVGVAQAACKGLPSHAELAAALASAQGEPNGGFGLNMWGTIVDRDGVVCAVAMTGGDRGDQWPGSRVISAQKANTANSFSLPGLSLSTANLWEATQPGGSLFGLQFSNPVDTAVAYGTGDSTQSANYGTRNDPLVSHQVGGVNVFGGGLALYNSDGTLVGAVGVSGDSSCADHNIAWRTRANLFLDNVPGGVGPNGLDGIDYLPSAAGFGHPVCGGTEQAVAIAISAGA